MRNKGLSVLIIVETTILGLVAMAIFGFLMDQYDRARAMAEEQSVAAQPTEVVVAVLMVTPTATSTPTYAEPATPMATPTRSVTPSSTRTASRPATQTRTRVPSATPLAVVPSAPSSSPTRTSPAPPTSPPAAVLLPTPAVPPTPRPTRTPVQASFTTLAGCDTIDEPGNYRLGSDLTANGDCIKIQTSYAIFDCEGHAIRGTNFGGSGIAVRKYGLLASKVPAYIEIRNCRVFNFKYGIFVESGKNLVIHDNNSSNNYDDTDPATRYGIFLGMTDGGGIRLNNTTDSYVFGNTTVHQAIGIDVRNSSNVAVRANTSSDNSAWGINFIATQHSEASSNVTADNIRKCVWGAGTVGFGCDAGGIVIQGGSSNNLIANNTVSGRNGNGIFIKAHSQPCGHNNTITGNTITSVLYNAVELGFCTGNRINGNLIRDGLDGIWLGFAHDTEIKNNTISNMRNHGIISSNSYNNVVSGNLVVNSNEGIYFLTEDYDREFFAWLPPGDYRSHDNCLCGNTLQNNSTVGIRLKDSTNNQVTNNTFQGNGRTVIVQGNGDGNNMQGNVGWSPPAALDRSIAGLFLSWR
ncbi:MAG: right-handed parallel beta-helix repeat-containing protein [Chloroflexi bacterium]|nr:right-handed parallel beta-helix repeat-containing protein [Chloroflexota bacterium]